MFVAIAIMCFVALALVSLFEIGSASRFLAPNAEAYKKKEKVPILEAHEELNRSIEELSNPQAFIGEALRRAFDSSEDAEDMDDVEEMHLKYEAQLRTIAQEQAPEILQTLGLKKALVSHILYGCFADEEEKHFIAYFECPQEIIITKIKEALEGAGWAWSAQDEVIMAQRDNEVAENSHSVNQGSELLHFQINHAKEGKVSILINYIKS